LKKSKIPYLKRREKAPSMELRHLQVELETCFRKRIKRISNRPKKKERKMKKLKRGSQKLWSQWQLLRKIVGAVCQ